MSLVPFAMRVATVRALQAALPASVLVCDSPQEPIALLDSADPLPIVAIYTGHSETMIDGREMLAGSPTVLLTFQFLLPESFVFTIAPGSTITIDTRRQGAETALDVLWRTCVRALIASDDPWAALWRDIVFLTPKITNSSYLIEQSKVRVVAREVSVSCEPLHEPVPGAAPEGVWDQLLMLMRADTKADGLAALGDWIEAEIRGGTDQPQALRDRFYMGISAATAGAIGLDLRVEDVGYQSLDADTEVSAAVDTEPNA